MKNNSIELKHQIPIKSIFIFFFNFVFACTGIPNGVIPVKIFDIDRYAGLWFDILRLDHSFKGDLKNATVNYKKM